MVCTYNETSTGLQHHRSARIDAWFQVFSGSKVVEHQHAKTRANRQNVPLKTCRSNTAPGISRRDFLYSLSNSKNYIISINILLIISLATCTVKQNNKNVCLPRQGRKTAFFGPLLFNFNFLCTTAIL